MKQAKATIIASLVAPAIPALTGAVLTPIQQSSINTNVASVLGLTLVFYPFVLILGGLVGFPLFLLLRKYGWVRWWSAVLVGALVGVFGAQAIRTPTIATISDLAIFVPEGAFAGFVFWAFWKLGDAQQVSS